MWRPFAPVVEGRQRADLEDDHCLFLIGFRLNKPWRIHEWLVIAWWTDRVVREMNRDAEEIGFLGQQRCYTIGTGPMLIQHWRSFEHLEAYGREVTRLHVPAWKRYNQAVRGTGSVGVWHETYLVGADEREAVYVNMPRVGLGQAGTLRRIGSSSGTAAQRMGRPDEAGAPVEG
jgi:hypothetical protein